jgi:hypothetical protein
MCRPWTTALLLAALVAYPSGLRAQTRAAPLYALPADGTWVEYDWEEVKPGGIAQTGTLRLSSVGATTVTGIAHRWVEIIRETRRAGKVERRSRKLLVDEQAFAAGRPLYEAVVRGYDKARDGSVIPMSRDRLRVFTRLGIQGAEEALRQVSTGEAVQTPLGMFRTRHVAARGSTAGRVLEYDGWLSPDLPFGWARMEIREPAGTGPPRLVFRASASRTGQSARAEVDETMIKGKSPSRN